LFAPTEQARQTLIVEGIPDDKIHMTGNTIVDAVLHNAKLSEKHKHVLDDLGLKKQGYFLATLHRQENVDDQGRFDSILRGLNDLTKKFNMPVIYPIHPRSSKKIREFKLDSHSITMVEPMDYLGFMQLEQNARVVFTDSGGVQEETCILGTPCVTLRDNTERPETLEIGSNVLAGVKVEDIVNCGSVMYMKKKDWGNPFGDGSSAKKIMRILGDVL
jgi:UDP-N-acetylglucosamine 2-epimerase (non-hydrolysing)